MRATRDMLQHVPLVAFLDAYPEPAFILSSNASPHLSLDFMYGNPALCELLIGHDDTAVLDDQVFFSVLASDEDIVWLSDPIRAGSTISTGDSQTINVRPAWLPRDHSAVDIELTPTPIDLPINIPGVGPATRSYVFTASPRQAPINLLRLENHNESGRRKDHGLHVPALPIPVSMSRRLYSRRSRSKSGSSSWPSQLTHAIDSAELPSRLIDTFPWEETSIGPRDKWPVSLKVMVKYLMEKPIPSSILWGWPDQVMIYNDSYARMIGSKHPAIFGKPGPFAWGELWEALAPLSDLVSKGKSTFRTDDQMFFNSLTDMHLPEEVYHCWHWTPIWQEDGSVGGIWNTTWETTQKVIAERRLSGMSELFSRLSDARTQEQFGERTLEVLSSNPLDLPFIALYWCEVENAPAAGSRPTHEGAPLALTYLRHHLSNSLINVKLTLARSVGIPDGHPIAPSTIQYMLDPVTYCPIQVMSDLIANETSPEPTTPCGETGGAASSLLGPASDSVLATPTYTSRNPERDSILDLARIFVSGTTELIDPLPPHLARALDKRGFGDLPRAAAVLPISTNSPSSASGRRTLPHAVLLLGLNTRRAYDADYAAWLESVGAGLSNQLTVVLQREADARMIEERERMDKAKTMFFTNASHELRTPLTLIQAPLEQLVASHHMSADVNYKLQLAMRNCKRLKKLIDSIMDISKLEAGRLVGSFQPVQLGRVTADLAALFRSMAEKKGIEYQILCDTADEPVVYVDIDLWEKIICNLLSNAFKYTTEGTVSVSITHDSTMAHVSVRDTGVGIPQEHFDQVFQRFFRVNNNTMAEGTGVGLSLTKELVSLHGGELTLQSQTQEEAPGNSGSVFTVLIPHGSAHLPPALIQDAVRTHASHKERDYWMELEQPTPSSSTASGEEEESIGSSTLFFEKDDTILVVDDNTDMRSYISKIFTPYLTVIEAHDGAEALQIARSQKLHLILCDVMMPKMDGPELLQRLRREQRTKLFPVIFLTASEDPSLIGGELEGAVDCISKPFRVRDLLARVHLQLQLGKRRIKLEADFEVRSHELQLLTEQSPVGIFRTDTDGKLTYLNRIWYQITGFSPDRPRDEWLDHLAAGSKEDAIRVWRACFEEYKSSTARLQWKNNVWTHCCIAPLMSPEGLFLGSFGTVTDIDEQSRLEEARIALAEEREHIAASRAEEAEAQRQLEVKRRTAQELLIDVTSHELRQPVSAIIQNAEVVRTNMKGLRDLLRDCRKRNISYAPTERMLNELEEDLQAMDSIMQCGLAQARIANDVLSLSRVQLNVLSIIPTEFDIRRETNQILMVFRNELTAKEINFELDLGRGTEMLGVQIVSTDRSRYAQIITNLMSNAIRFTDISTGRREIKVSLEVSLDPPLDDSCAPPPLIPGRRSAARSPMSESDDMPMYIYVSVQDSGPGLHKEDLALLFQRFQQGSNAHHVFGGSGLGLFVCRQLCNLMGGKIEVVSEPGEGATFRFFIKAVALSESKPQPLPVTGLKLRRSGSIHSRASGASKTSARSGSRPLPETPNIHHNRPLHVLITEDNKINQKVLARQMKGAGFTITLASNGLEAIQAIEKSESQANNGSTVQKFDVVLMDLEMPVLDGFEATREIRQRESAGIFQTRSFIIALTGNARSEQVQAARDAGVDDVTIKPYQIDALISKMRAGCEHKPE